MPGITVPQRLERFIISFSELSSWQYRLLCGGASVGIQNRIEANNRDVDDSTRRVSTLRTTSKLAIGTVVGTLTRYLSEKSGQKWAKRHMKEYPKAVGNTFALAATIIGAIAIEPPLTDRTLNRIMRHKKGNKLDEHV